MEINRRQFVASVVLAAAAAALMPGASADGVPHSSCDESPLIDTWYVWPAVSGTATEYVCTGGVDGSSMICLPSRRNVTSASSSTVAVTTPPLRGLPLAQHLQRRRVDDDARDHVGEKCHREPLEDFEDD